MVLWHRPLPLLPPHHPLTRKTKEIFSIREKKTIGRSKKCDPEACELPWCYCSPTGSEIPNGLQVGKTDFSSLMDIFQLDETPQMVLIMLDGAVNQVFTSIIITREVLVLTQPGAPVVQKWPKALLTSPVAMTEFFSFFSSFGMTLLEHCQCCLDVPDICVLEM